MINVNNLELKLRLKVEKIVHNNLRSWDKDKIIAYFLVDLSGEKLVAWAQKIEGFNGTDGEFLAKLKGE